LRAVALALGLACVAGSAAAQTMRPFTTYRQLHGETRLTAALDYAAGSLRVAPGRPTELYRMDVSYDGERYQPISDFDASRSAVALGLEATGSGGLRVVSRNQLRQTASVAFSPRVDLDLEFALGASDADIELGGLRVAEWKVQTGASQAVVRFSQPNGTRCRSGSVKTGAADLTVLGLANSRCDRLDFEGGIGKMTLDFGGAGAVSSAVGVKMAVGELVLRLPRGTGVRISLDKFFASFKPAGLTQKGTSYESPDYDQAERKLNVAVKTAVGEVRVEWID
jgi:cell wall-active antibiotic response 4TMS protein YvqF